MRTEKKRTVRGAVLFTVISVMSLLIIFLTGTLMLATSAHQRANRSYAFSQANYTARATIDGIVEAVKSPNDTTLATNIFNLRNNGVGAKYPLTVSLENNSKAIGRIDDAYVTYEGKKPYYKSSTMEWVDADLFKISVEVTYAGQTNTTVAYMLDNTIIKEGPPPDSNGGFVTVGNASIANHTNSFGGSFFGIGLNKGDRYYMGDLGWSRDVTLGDKLYLNYVDKTPDMQGDINFLKYPTDEVVKYTLQNDTAMEAPLVFNGSLDLSTKLDLYFTKKNSSPNYDGGMAVWGDLYLQNKDFKIHTETLNDSYYNNASYKSLLEMSEFNELPYLYVDRELKFQTGHDGLGQSNIPFNIFTGSIKNSGGAGATIYANVYCHDANQTSFIGNTAGQTKLYTWSNSVVNKTAGYLGQVTDGTFATKGNLVVEGNGAVITGDLIVEGDLTVNGELTVGGTIVVKGTLTNHGSINTSNQIYANFAQGNQFTNSILGKKKAANGVDDLYVQEIAGTHTAFLGQNVNTSGDGSHSFAWLKRDVITDMGLTLTNGMYDFNWSFIDSKYFVSDAGGWLSDPATVAASPISYNDYIYRNVDDPTDTTTNENDIYETSVTFNGNPVFSTDTYEAAHGCIFPKYAEQDVILGFTQIDGKPDTQTKILRTIDEIEDDYQFATKSTTAIPATYIATVEGTVYNNGNVPAEITSDCTLEGGFSGKNLTIKGISGGDIWVKLKNNFSFDGGHNYDIIYDDSDPNCGNLYLFVENQANVTMGRIITKSYKDAIDGHQDFQIKTKIIKPDGPSKILSTPKITIYSSKAEGGVEPKLTGSNGFMATACIQAPYMKFDAPTVFDWSSPDIYYDGVKINSTTNATRIGVIGVLNVAEANSQNNFVFLYTPESNTTPPSSGSLQEQLNFASGDPYRVVYYDLT